MSSSGGKNQKEHILHYTVYSTFSNSWQLVMYQKLPTKEMTADQDADWITCSTRGHKFSRVCKLILKRKCLKMIVTGGFELTK